MRLSEAKYLRALIEEAVQNLTDDKAVQAKMLYPKWAELIGTMVENAGFKFQHNGKLYKTRQDNHSFQAHWVPGETGTESLYEMFDEQHKGTPADPIPFNGNMVLIEGMYYEEKGCIYICMRDSVIPVYNALAELVGIYVEECMLGGDS